MKQAVRVALFILGILAGAQFGAAASMQIEGQGAARRDFNAELDAALDRERELRAERNDSKGRGTVRVLRFLLIPAGFLAGAAVRKALIGRTRIEGASPDDTPDPAADKDD